MPTIPSILDLSGEFFPVAVGSMAKDVKPATFFLPLCGDTPFFSLVIDIDYQMQSLRLHINHTKEKEP